MKDITTNNALALLKECVVNGNNSCLYNWFLGEKDSIEQTIKEMESIRKTEMSNEQLVDDAVYTLGLEMYDQSPDLKIHQFLEEHTGLLRYESNGQYIGIFFLGIQIWNNDDDPRDTDDETGEPIESLIDYLRKEIKKIIFNISGIFNMPDKEKKKLNGTTGKSHAPDAQRGNRGIETGRPGKDQGVPR